jgi:hypothetical protein
MVNVVKSLPDGSDESKEEWGNYERPGDIKNMKCHDICCTIVFLVFFLAAVAIMIVGVVKGKIWSVYNSWDSMGQYCGKNNIEILKDVKNKGGFPFQDLTDYPYLFFNALDTSVQICVKKCPTENDISDVLLMKLGDEQNPELKTLGDDTSLYKSDYYKEETKAIFKDSDKIYQYKSTNMFNRCVPDIDFSKIANFSQFKDGFNQMVDSIPSLASSLNAVSKLWWKIIVCCIGSLIVAFVWILLLRCMTGCIVYFVVFLLPVAVIGIAFWLFFMGDKMDTIAKIQENKQLTSAQITAIVLWCIAFILILIIIFLFKKLKSAVQMIKIATKALGSNWTVIFIPFISMIIAFLIWALILASSVFIYTSNEFEIREQKIEFSRDDVLQYFLIFNLIYLIFISVQIYFTNYYATSTPIVQWYFSDQGAFGCGCSCWRGFLNAFTKSLGTITVSSIIMTPLYLFLIFMEYLDVKAQKEDANEFIKCLIKCFKCCLMCFAKIVKYLNKTLLTVQQIFNKNWLKSADIVSDVVLSDVIMTSLLNGISFFILFLSKCSVSIICTLLFCVWVDKEDSGIGGYLLSAFIVFFVSFIVSSFILSAYDNVIDIVFVCYQSGNAIPGFKPGENTSGIQQTIEEAKAASQQESSKVEAEGPSKVEAEGPSDEEDCKVHYGE